MSSRKPDYVIYCGRYQPFHNGHLQMLRAALRLSARQHVLGVIINSVSSASGKRATKHLKRGDLAQRPERNPLTIAERLLLIREVMHLEGLDAQVVLTAIPRPELYWEIVRAMMPGTRTWVLPQQLDEFDRGKKKFFESRGDRVALVHSSRLLSGTSIREALVSGDARVAKAVPKSVFTFLRKLDIHG